MKQRARRVSQHGMGLGVVLGSLMVWTGAHAGMTTDGHGNVGYDSAAECDAAVVAGKARFYKSYTHNPRCSKRVK